MRKLLKIFKDLTTISSVFTIVYSAALVGDVEGRRFGVDKAIFLLQTEVELSEEMSCDC